ncbi:MAG: TetR/AcrR family transcriptional regulator [Candidatus Binataceae bacterium]
MDARVHNSLQRDNRLRLICLALSYYGARRVGRDIRFASNIPVNDNDKRKLLRSGPTRTDEPGEPRAGRRPIPMLHARILKSAMELFGDKGFDYVPIDEVAAHAGVGKGSVYRQFGSKEQLYAESVIEGFVQLRNQIETGLTGAASIPERIATIVRHTLSYFWTRRQFFVLLRDPTKLPRAQEIRYRRERGHLSSLINEVLREGANSGLIREDLDFDLLSESLLGMIRGVQRYKGPNVQLEEATRTVVATFLYGSTTRPHSG